MDVIKVLNCEYEYKIVKKDLRFVTSSLSPEMIAFLNVGSDNIGRLQLDIALEYSSHIIPIEVETLVDLDKNKNLQFIRIFSNAHNCQSVDSNIIKSIISHIIDCNLKLIRLTSNRN